MASAVKVFEQQAAGYDRYVRENWTNLEQWERDQHAAFASWATDRNVVSRFVATPAERTGRRPRNRYEASHAKRGSLRTVSLAYGLILASVFFFPILFGGAGIALGFINLLRQRWDHGLVQIALAAGVIASSLYGISMSEFTVPYLNSIAASLR